MSDSHFDQAREADKVPPAGGIQHLDKNSIKLNFDNAVPDEMRKALLDWRKSIANGISRSNYKQEVSVGIKKNSAGDDVVVLGFEDKLSKAKSAVEIPSDAPDDEIQKECARLWTRTAKQRIATSGVQSSKKQKGG